ncbi:MAG: CdaR family protein [Calditrichota bacterium]
MTFVPRWLRENLRVKFGLLILASALWFLVITQQTYEYILNVPIAVSDLQPGKIVASALPAHAKVRIQGTGRELLRLIFFTHPVLTLNLSALGDRQKLDLRPEMVTLPGGLNAVALEVSFPDSLEIHLEPLLEIELPIKLRAALNTSAGYVVIGEPHLNPNLVKVIGPYDVVIKLKYLETQSITLNNLRRNTEITVDLKENPSFGVTYSAQSVNALINVERLVERPLVGIPVKVKNLPPGRETTLEPSVIDVQISGPFGLVGEATIDEVDAWVDYNEYLPLKSNRVPVHAQIESPLEVSQISPQELRLTIRRQ